MLATLWLLAALVGCLHFRIVSSDVVISDPSSISQLASNFNPSKRSATLQKPERDIPKSLFVSGVPVFGNKGFPVGFLNPAPSSGHNVTTGPDGKTTLVAKNI
ncbi:hypothetical protein AVEN_85132-1 [Araneus ventricosus]|uniref:Uncharacterized protein n=1 Tax=Araneus ventricosus TaxID=182803 RepID=A0A4Y2V3Y0_ARAVE|nr:hypothetical protein AVEN_44671-1 [Araneus ventricosus]GBO19328.1 hypothetical protein AVEN_85132-1 [Araneus ventricosus]